MTSTFLCALIIKCEKPNEIAAWYKEVLGLPLEEKDHEHRCMLGQLHFAIHGLQKGQTSTTNAELGIYVPDLDEFVKNLQSRKIELADPIREYPWARSGQLRDPLDNVIYLMQLPKSSIKEIGEHLAKEFNI